jgi:hypothetical protein
MKRRVLGRLEVRADARVLDDLLKETVLVGDGVGIDVDDAELGRIAAMAGHLRGADFVDLGRHVGLDLDVRLPRRR